MTRKTNHEFLYGRQAVREALRVERRRPFRLLVAKQLEPAAIVDEILSIARQRHLPIQTLARTLLSRMVGVRQHQGIALEVTPYPYLSTDAILQQAEVQGVAPFLLMLDLIQDIHNLGSLIRTAEAVGVHGVFIQERRAAGITPDTVNTASGATEHMAIAQVTNLAREMETLKDAGVWIAGLEGGPEAQMYTALDMTGPLCIVVGNEGRGLRRLVRERCDWLIALPMKGKIESLNASVAGSIALYEALRQRAG